MDNFTPDQFRAMMPRLPIGNATLYYPFLSDAMVEGQITTSPRMAAFLAQLAHESYQLHYTAEVWGPSAAQNRYEPTTRLSLKLGNTSPGDGYLFRGRGPIQLTGRGNYRICGQALGLDLENNPDQAEDPDVMFRTAVWYWTVYNLNSLADAANPTDGISSFQKITQAINGGQNGEDDREHYYQNAWAIFGPEWSDPYATT